MKVQTHQSAKELFDSLVDDTALQQQFSDQLKERRVIKTLVAMRVSKGITQSQVAAVRGVTQGRISKLERGPDSALTLDDLQAYGKACQHDVTIFLSERGLSLTERIKWHALQIRLSFERLVELANRDTVIAEGVAKFHAEAFLNFNRILQETAARIPLCPETGQPWIQVASSFNPEEDTSVSRPDESPVKKPERKSKRRARLESAGT